MTYAWPRICAATALLERVAEDRRDRVGVEVGAAAGPVHQRAADPLEALHDPLANLVGILSFRHAAVELDVERSHAGRADHPGGGVRGGLQVSADAAGVLAVEDVLGGHRAEDVDQRSHLLVLPAAEALLALERLVMAE